MFPKILTHPKGNKQETILIMHAHWAWTLISDFNVTLRIQYVVMDNDCKKYRCRLSRKKSGPKTNFEFDHVQIVTLALGIGKMQKLFALALVFFFISSICSDGVLFQYVNNKTMFFFSETFMSQVVFNKTQKNRFGINSLTTFYAPGIEFWASSFCTVCVCMDVVCLWKK